MPEIVNSSVLRNKYNELSARCHEEEEPLFLTKNGKGDMVLMSLERYNSIDAELQLYKSILKGIVAVQEGRIIPEKTMMEKLQKYASL
jgi:prevent-host-death family protein